jgi:hypothetical protein
MCAPTASSVPFRSTVKYVDGMLLALSSLLTPPILEAPFSECTAVTLDATTAPTTSLNDIAPWLSTAHRHQT